MDKLHFDCDICMIAQHTLGGGQGLASNGTQTPKVTSEVDAWEKVFRLLMIMRSNLLSQEKISC